MGSLSHRIQAPWAVPSYKPSHHLSSIPAFPSFLWPMLWLSQVPVATFPIYFSVVSLPLCCGFIGRQPGHGWCAGLQPLPPCATLACSSCAHLWCSASSWQEFWTDSRDELMYVLVVGLWLLVMGRCWLTPALWLFTASRPRLCKLPAVAQGVRGRDTALPCPGEPVAAEG